MTKQVIFFDAAGTLFHVKGSVGNIYLQYAESYGLPNTPENLEKVNKAFSESFKAAPPPLFAVEHPEKLKQCERLWWFDIVHGVFYRTGMIEKFDDYFEEVFEVFGTAEPWEVYPEVFQALDSLRKQGLELGVISNFDTRFYQIFRALGLEGYFDSITISSIARSVKPTGDIFHYALTQHVADPQDAVHVGDSIREDVEGAERAGITGIWVNREREALPNGAVHPQREVQSLEEVGGLLDQL
ncbi:MAG: HAD-IA family hydrolase [Nitrospirae bacterium]|nr:HAD-IA family hydrolase [Nitrospirota bacterium]